MTLKCRAGSIPARGTENQAIMSKFHSRFFIYTNDGAGVGAGVDSPQRPRKRVHTGFRAA